LAWSGYSGGRRVDHAYEGLAAALVFQLGVILLCAGVIGTVLGLWMAPDNTAWKCRKCGVVLVPRKSGR
jgi:hypothetical protein